MMRQLARSSPDPEIETASLNLSPPIIILASLIQRHPTRQRERWRCLCQPYHWLLHARDLMCSAWFLDRRPVVGGWSCVENCWVLSSIALPAQPTAHLTGRLWVRNLAGLFPCLRWLPPSLVAKGISVRWSDSNWTSPYHLPGERQ